MSWQNNDYKQIKDMAYLNFTNKADAVEFVNDYKDCDYSKEWMETWRQTTKIGL